MCTCMSFIVKRYFSDIESCLSRNSKMVILEIFDSYILISVSWALSPKYLKVMYAEGLIWHASCLWPTLIYCCQSRNLQFHAPSCQQFPHYALSSKHFSISSHFYMHSNDHPASLCTSELCKEGTIKLQLYCIASRSVTIKSI